MMDFSTALFQAASARKKVGKPCKLVMVRAHLEPRGEWELFLEALIDRNMSCKAIYQALILCDIKVGFVTVQRWRTQLLQGNPTVWALVTLGMDSNKLQLLQRKALS